MFLFEFLSIYVTLRSNPHWSVEISIVRDVNFWVWWKVDKFKCQQIPDVNILSVLIS